MDVSFRTLLILFHITSLSVFIVASEEPYYGMCANPFCSEPIAYGMAILKYAPGEHDRIKLNVKQEFEIFVKDYGEKKNLLGIMINGQKGYVPKNVVQEQRTIQKILVPATVEFMYPHGENPNQETNQIHYSMSRQEIIHHTSPDGYAHESNYHSNYPSESYGHHSEMGWHDESSNMHTSPHIHVINSHVEATVTSHTSNVAQHSNTWESTSHIHAEPENSFVSSYSSGGQQGSYQNNAPQQQYYESAYTNENQLQSQYQNSAPQQQYSDSMYTNEHQQQSTYQNAAPNEYSQSVYPNEYQSSQFGNVLQTSFSPQMQSNLQFAQNSPSNQMDTDVTIANEAQNYAHSPHVEGSFSSYTSEIQHSPDESVSTQYSSLHLREGETFHSISSYVSQNLKAQIDISGTIAALKAQGYNEEDLKAFFDGEMAHHNPSHISYSEQEVHGTNKEFSSHQQYLDSENEFNSNSMLRQPPLPSHAASSEDGRADYPSSSEQFYSTQTQQSSSVSESSLQTLHEDVTGNEEEVDDSGELSNDKEENEIFYEKNSKKLAPLEVKEESHTEHLENQERAPSPFPQDFLQSVVQTTIEQATSYTRESNTLSPQSETISETKSKSKISTEYPQSTKYSDSSQNNFFENTPNKILTSDNEIDNNFYANDNFKEPSVSDAISSSNSLPNNTIEEKGDALDLEDASTFGDTENNYDKSGFFFEKVEDILQPENTNENDTSLDKEQNDDLEKLFNMSELNEAEQNGYLNAYQIRNLKGEQENKDSQNSELLEEAEGNASSIEFNLFDYIENTVGAIRSFVEILLSWIPEPLYSILMELESKGISPRVPVFTALSAIPCFFLIVALVYVKERSKEQKLIAQLAFAEKNVYTLSAEKSVLEEKLEKVEAELESCKATLTTERKFYDDLKAEVVSLNQELEKSNIELEKRVDEIQSLKEQEMEFSKLIADNEKNYLELVEEKNQLNKQLNCQDETISQFNDQLQEKDKEVKELQEEKMQYSKANEIYEEKLTQLQQNCNQLLEEAEIWNLRVNELNTKLSEETQTKQHLEESLKSKDGDIESLTFLVENFKSFEELEDADSDEYKSKKEKLQCLLKSANISIILQRQEEENKIIMQKLSEEKNKILEMEVELLEAKSEIDKLKLNYNQALQDKTEAQTKLEVLTNYFKDKEIQLQKQLGAQEVFREKREKDADSAERRIVLIEQENTSYKSQVASMKQEMEETERNFKSQIATQEKKAHENWIAARAAERKLEDMKQEVTQLRQKLTLLERDQGNFINASRDDIIRPIPQRIAGVNNETINSQDINNSMDEPPSMYRMPLPHMMLPDMPRDRPLPPLPLPPPPFEPPPMFAPPPFGPFPRDPMFNSEFRVTPPEFARGRASTPPRGRQSAINDSDMGPRQSSPLGSELRESRNSTPPHSLPDFHDIPPPPRPPFYPPHRFPFRPPFRRDFPPGPPRPDYQGENSQSRGTQPSSVPQDSWPPSNSRV